MTDRHTLNFTAAGTPRLSASTRGQPMKKEPAKMGKPTRERDQGRIKGSGINKGMVKESVPQVVMRNTYGKPTQTQKM